MQSQANATISDLRVPLVVRYNIRKKVKRTPSGCLLWTGSTLMNGYGIVHVNKKPYLVHRIVYYLGHGDFTGMVLHSCDRRNCIELTHLHLGNHSMNTREAVARGRHWAPTGEAHHLTRMTEDDVREIRTLKGVVLTKELATRFQVATNTITRIQAGVRWTHVSD